MWVHSTKKKGKSLWIYMTVDVEYMQTVFEGLHVERTIANVDDFDNLAIICLVKTFCWDLSQPGCVFFFFKASVTRYKHTKMHKETHVYNIYIYIKYKYKYILYILFCKSCFELQMYGCNASWVIEKVVWKYDLYPQRNDCRKWNKTSLSMHCLYCHETRQSL